MTVITSVNGSKKKKVSTVKKTSSVEEASPTSAESIILATFHKNKKSSLSFETILDALDPFCLSFHYQDKNYIAYNAIHSLVDQGMLSLASKNMPIEYSSWSLTANGAKLKKPLPKEYFVEVEVELVTITYDEKTVWANNQEEAEKAALARLHEEYDPDDVADMRVISVKPIK